MTTPVKRSSAALEAAFTRWGDAYRLTPTELALLRAAVQGLDRAEFAARRLVSYGTAKKHGQILIDKTGDTTLDRAANRLLREALEATDEMP